MLRYLGGLAEKSVNSEGREVWALNERSRARLTFANWGIWLASVSGGLIFAVNWVARGKTDVALCEYLVFIENFWSGKPLHVMNGLHGFHYLPVMLVIGTPLDWVSVPVAGAIFGLLSIGFLATAFTGSPKPSRRRIRRRPQVQSCSQAWWPRPIRSCCSRCRRR